MSEHARGTFAVTITPQPPDDSGFGRLDLAKQWQGDLDATSSGLMLSAGDPSAGSAGYVALEVVEGSLHGRVGSFAFQQLGVMQAGDQELRYDVVPGSGSGELAGLTGSLELTIEEDGTHRYDLGYVLPG